MTNVKGHATIGNRELCFRIRVRHCSESRLHFRILHHLCHRVLCRPSRYFMLQEQVLRRPTECLLQSRKHSVGRHDAFSHGSEYSVARQDALSNRSMTNPGQEWLFAERSKHSVGRHNAPSHKSKYSDGRQSTLSKCGNILSAVTMLYASGANTLSAVGVLPQFAQTSCRPTECCMR